MGASDLPLDIQQRIESRWSAQMRRLQQERDCETKAVPSSDSDNPDGFVDIAKWGKPQPDDG